MFATLSLALSLTHAVTLTLALTLTLILTLTLTLKLTRVQGELARQHAGDRAVHGELPPEEGARP